MTASQTAKTAASSTEKLNNIAHVINELVVDVLVDDVFDARKATTLGL